MANFDTQIQALAGTATQTEMDDWATDAVKEIINILPPELKMECSTITNLYIGNTDTVMDLDVTGEISHVTRENADSGYFAPCRKIHPMHAGLISDSSSLHYATVTDPVYWIESDSGGDPKLHVYPTATALQPAKVYHITYPTVDVSAVSAIVNFPNEAEYLVVLYTAVKVLQNKMNEMNSLAAIDTTAFGAITTELNKVDDIINEASGKIDDYYTSIGDIDDTTELWDNTNKRFTVVRDALLLAQNLIDNDQPNSNYDAYANLLDVDEAMRAIDAHLTDSEAVLGSNPSSGDISTALGLIKTAIDQAASAADKFEAADGDSIFGDEATFLTADSQLAHVSDALIKAQNLIDGATMGGDTEPQSVQYWLNDEDTEMVQATLQTAQAEIQRAQTSIQHWVSIGDMRAKQANAALAEANGYISEAKIRMERDSQKYQWYQAQQAKLQQDYDKGLAALKGGQQG